MTHNGSNVKIVNFNGQKLKKWYHNGLLAYQGATPWKPYENVNNVMVANSPATTPYSTKTVTPVPSIYCWQVASGLEEFATISTNNVDGTRYIPTQGCKYLDIIVVADYPQSNTAEVYALVDGKEVLIHTKKIPNVNNNKDNYLDGVQINQYAHNWTNIDVEGYDLIKVVQKGTGSDSRGVTLGIGVANFHN